MTWRGLSFPYQSQGAPISALANPETQPMTTMFRQRPGFVDVFATRAEVDAMRAEAAAASPSLTGRTLRSLRTYFDAQGHYPSEEHWVALWAIASTMEAMVDGRCAPKVHLSACDPGVGKSQTVIHLCEALAADPAYAHAGVIVSAFTIAEIMALADQLQAIRGSLCVLTSNPTANAMGGAEANDAQILLTTQNRLGRLTETRPFASVSAFHYRGEPRACRVWDESLLPGRVVNLDANALIRMATRLSSFSVSLRDALYRFGMAVLTLEDGAAVDVPDFGPDCGVNLEELPTLLPAEHREAATDLLIVTGRRVRVRQDGQNGSALLTFREELPTDLLPMLVLDASARVRETYTLWENSRQVIARLPAAVRDYAPLTVRTWRTSGAKSGWEKNGARLTEGVVATILSKPSEFWLVVVHKPNATQGDTEKAIRSKLPADVRGRVFFTTWGRHTGVNDWADVSNVVLAGTLFYPAAHITGLHHLCANLPVDGGLAGRPEQDRMSRGESRHLILQAICRGRVRKSDGARCQPMTAYVIASPRSGIEEEAATVFPGCSQEAWEPLKVEAQGKVKEAIDHLTAAFAAGRTEVSYLEVYEALGLDRGSFSTRIAKAPAWMQTVDALGAEVGRRTRGALWVHLLPADGAS